MNTVSKLLILVFAPVNIAKMKVDIQIRWSPKLGTKTFFLHKLKLSDPKILILLLEAIVFTPICFKTFCISIILLLSLLARSFIPLKIEIPFVKDAITNNGKGRHLDDLKFAISTRLKQDPKFRETLKNTRHAKLYSFRHGNPPRLERELIKARNFKE